MSNHEHDAHDDHHTEGDRQSYKKGWWISIVGLLIVALGFAAIGTIGLSHSGTERWGKSEQCDEKCEKDGACCEGEKECKDGEKECKEGEEHHGAAVKGESHDSVAGHSENHNHDSVAAKPAGHDHE